MRLEMRPRFLTYVGNDRGMVDLLAHMFDPDIYRIEHDRIEDWAHRSVAPSWRCERTVILDQFESPAALRILEELSRHDAGIPVIVLVESGRRMRMSVAGAARLHGADRMVLKPLKDPAVLRSAIDAAFRRLDHWRLRFEQPCFLQNLPPLAGDFEQVGSMIETGHAASSIIKEQFADALAPC